jgi:GMP synthase-like glutamine amidotransferase
MKHAIKANPNLKFLGVCFGVQFLAHLFDGNVTKARQRTWKIENICIRR